MEVIRVKSFRLFGASQNIHGHHTPHTVWFPSRRLDPLTNLLVDTYMNNLKEISIRFPEVHIIVIQPPVAVTALRFFPGSQLILMAVVLYSCSVLVGVYLLFDWFHSFDLVCNLCDQECYLWRNEICIWAKVFNFSHRFCFNTPVWPAVWIFLYKLHSMDHHWTFSRYM